MAGGTLRGCLGLQLGAEAENFRSTLAPRGHAAQREGNGAEDSPSSPWHIRWSQKTCPGNSWAHEKSPA